MQEPIQYTPSDVRELRPKIEKMVEQVIDAIVTVPDWTKVDFQRCFSVDGNAFCFIFKTVSPSLQQALSDIPPGPEAKAVAASVKIHGQDFFIVSQVKDHGGEFLLTPELLDRLTNVLVDSIVRGMARNWYESNLLSQIENTIEKNGEEKTFHLIDERIVYNYGSHGYAITVYEDHDKTAVIYQAKETNMLYIPGHSYKGILIGCIHNLIPILMATELIYKGQWSNSLCE